MVSDRAIIQTANSWPPVDTVYTAGLWHRDRFTIDGYLVEAKVRALAATKSESPDLKRFLIISRARSGTTLLTKLLDANPKVECDGEVLHRGKVFPLAYLRALARKSPARAYGAKLLSYQMVQVQRLLDPIAFLRAVHSSGFRLIHLRRQTFWQTLSLVRAHATGKYHSNKGARYTGPIVIDPERFVRNLEWNELLLRYESECLRNLPHLQVDYETGLMHQDRHQNTVDRIFEYVGIDSALVSTGLQKITPSDPNLIIGNYPRVRQAMIDAGFAKLLPREDTIHSVQHRVI